MAAGKALLFPKDFNVQVRETLAMRELRSTVEVIFGQPQYQCQQIELRAILSRSRRLSQGFLCLFTLDLAF